MEEIKIKEDWRDIDGFEGYYQISNLGRVKRLKRNVPNNKGIQNIPERLLKPYADNNGYLLVSLSKNGKVKRVKVHKLVAITFLNHTPCGLKLVIDHINNDKLDNRAYNLQIITNRENTSKDKKGCSSIYTGVSWHKTKNKWISGITINNKLKYLGMFNCETKAHLAYQLKLKELNG